MKGQRLFVRPIETADAAAIRAFAARYGGSPETRCGLLGKLVGELVSVLSMEIENDAVHLVELIVAEELRRKRVGRVMLNELATLAATLEKTWLVAGVENRAFLERVGFVEDGGLMRRRV